MLRDQSVTGDTSTSQDWVFVKMYSCTFSGSNVYVFFCFTYLRRSTNYLVISGVDGLKFLPQLWLNVDEKVNLN